MVHFIPPSQRRLAMLAAQADTAPALISGASGSGKGVIVRWIHENSSRAAHPLVTAVHDKPLSEQIPLAQGGTFVIPEIGECTLTEQKDLLHFLRTKSVKIHLDGDLPMLLNVRIIATTSQALDARAQGGLFNTELLEKLNVFRIEMPSLSKRVGEFEDIVTGVLGEITRELHKEHLRTLSPEALKRLSNYEWPGNIRELRNVLRLSVLAAKGEKIEVLDLPQFGHDQIDFRATREQFERIYIQELLRAFNFEVDRACRVTRIDKKILLSKMKQYGIAQGNPSQTEPFLH
ncbi:MAG: sigma 54-interacting transcriptional regulator [Bdellovibrionota bacterium]